MTEEAAEREKLVNGKTEKVLFLSQETTIEIITYYSFSFFFYKNAIN